MIALLPKIHFNKPHMAPKDITELNHIFSNKE